MLRYRNRDLKFRKAYEKFLVLKFKKLVNNKRRNYLIKIIEIFYF